MTWEIYVLSKCINIFISLFKLNRPPQYCVQI